MKTIVRSILVVLVAIVASCEQEYRDGLATQQTPKLSISFKVPTGSAGTYSSATDAEKLVSTMAVFFADATGTCKGGVYLNGVTGTDISFDLPSSVSIGGTYLILLIANPDGYLKASGLTTTSMDDLVKGVVGNKLNETLYFEMSDGGVTTPLPMVGLKSVTIPSSGAITFLDALERAVAKVTIDQTLTGKTISELYLKGGATKSEVIAGWSALSGLPSGTVGSTSISGNCLYMFTTPFQSGSEAEVVGKVVSNTDGTTTYFSMKLVDGANIRDIARGNEYRYTLPTSIGITGLSIESPTYITANTVNSWPFKFEGKYDSNGADELMVETGSIVLAYNVKGCSFKVRTPQGIPSSVSVTSTVGNATYASGEVTFNFTDNNNTATSKTAIVTVDYGSASIPVTITQLTQANLGLDLGNFDADKLFFGPSGGTYKANNSGVDMTVSCGVGNWDFSSSETFVTLSKVGNNLEIAVSPIITTTPGSSTTRSATVTVASTEGLKRSFVVTQSTVSTFNVQVDDGSSNYIDLSTASPSLLQIDCDGGLSNKKTFKVTNESSFDVLTSDSNFTINGTGSTSQTIATSGGSATFYIQAAPQPVLGAASRSATITVTGGSGKKVTFTVTQEPVVVASNDEGVAPAGSSIYWFNRNLSASNSSFFTNANSSLAGTSSGAKGALVKASDISTNPCPIGWKYPTEIECYILAGVIKSGQSNGCWVFYIDGLTPDRIKKRVFFPVVGTSDTPPGSNLVQSRFINADGSHLNVDGTNTNSPSVENGEPSDSYSVRCVRTIPTSGSLSVTAISSKTSINSAGTDAIEIEVQSPSDWAATLGGINKDDFILTRVSNTRLKVYAKYPNNFAIKEAAVNFKNKEGKTTQQIITQKTGLGFKKTAESFYAHCGSIPIEVNNPGNYTQYEIEISGDVTWLKLGKNDGMVGDIYSPSYGGILSGGVASGGDNDYKVCQGGYLSSNIAYLHFRESNLSTSTRVVKITLKDENDKEVASMDVTQNSITNIGNFGDDETKRLGVDKSFYFSNLIWSNNKSTNYKLASTQDEKMRGLKKVKTNIQTLSASDFGLSGSFAKNNTVATRACVSLNIDIDGDGTIKDGENIWYLPAQKQLMAAYLSKIFNEVDWTITEYDNSKALHVSSGDGGVSVREKNEDVSKFPIRIRCVADF